MPETPEWVRLLPGRLCHFIIRELRYPDHGFGLFRTCPDSTVPFDLPASVVAYHNLARFGALADIPGYSEEAVDQTAAFIQNCQDAETGLFIDPHLDQRFADTHDDPAERTVFRHNVSKYCRDYLVRLGARPLYGYSSTSTGGGPDPEGYLRALREADWSHPWRAGSALGYQTVELFERLNAGHEELRPALEEGMTFLLALQEPDGLWGAPELPLYQRLAGGVKIAARLHFQTGLPIPRLPALSQTLVAHLFSGEVFTCLDHACVPRHTVELVALCAEDDGANTAELAAATETLALHMRFFVMPDGGLSPHRDGSLPVTWCGAPIAPASAEFRGCASSAILYGLGIAGQLLGWDECPIASPLAGYRRRLARYRWRPQLDRRGRVTLVRRD